MSRMTVGEILHLIEDEIEPKKFLNKISNNFRDKTNRFNVKKAKNYVLFEMDEDEAQQSMDGIKKWLKSDKRNGDFDDGDKPNIDYWWFGLPDPPLDESWDDDDYDDYDDDYGDSYLDRYEGGRRRRRKRTRRKRGGGTAGLQERCGTNDDCIEGLVCIPHRLLSGRQVDNNQKGTCQESEGGRRRRRKRTRKRKKSKRRKRKRKRTKKKRRRRRRK